MLEISNFQRVGEEDDVAANHVKKSTNVVVGLAGGAGLGVDADVDN